MIACTSPAGTPRESPLRISLSSTAACRLETDSILAGLIGEELGHDLQRVLDALDGLLFAGRAGTRRAAALVGQRDAGLAALEIGGDAVVRVVDRDRIAADVRAEVPASQEVAVGGDGGVQRLGALEICLLLPPLGLLPGAALHLATRELGFERVFQRQNPGLARPGGHSSTAFLSSIFSTTPASAPLPWAKA